MNWHFFENLIKSVFTGSLCSHSELRYSCLFPEQKSLTSILNPPLRYIVSWTTELKIEIKEAHAELNH